MSRRPSAQPPAPPSAAVIEESVRKVLAEKARAGVLRLDPAILGL